MEKTVPRQFFDRIYGGSEISESERKQHNKFPTMDQRIASPECLRSSSNSSSDSNIPQIHTFQEHVPFMAGLHPFLARRRRKESHPRRQRTTFSGAQTIQLEHEFLRNEYISRGKRFELAEKLRLSESQIKIWFQNRRAKDKRIEKAQTDHQYRVFMNTFLPQSRGGQENPKHYVPENHPRMEQKPPVQYSNYIF